MNERTDEGMYRGGGIKCLNCGHVYNMLQHQCAHMPIHNLPFLPHTLLSKCVRVCVCMFAQTVNSEGSPINQQCSHNELYLHTGAGTHTDTGSLALHFTVA